MRKIGLGILIAVVTVVLTVGVASALPTLPGNQGTGKAKEVSPAVDEATGELKAPPEFVADLPESELTKIVFIRYAPGFPKIKPAKPVCSDDVAHPSEQCGEPGLPECPTGEKCINCKCVAPEEEPAPTTACYAFLAGSKPRWNWVEDYYYSTSTLGTTSAWATKTWDDVTSATIFGSGISEVLNWGVYDYKNSVSFGNYPEEGVLAVTAIWFRAKNIYEYDIMLDIDYTWGDANVDPTVFDLGTVTLHEFGHGAGLSDLYDVACIDNVMYGYLGLGEVKRALQSGDIAGIQTLYGK